MINIENWQMGQLAETKTERDRMKLHVEVRKRNESINCQTGSSTLRVSYGSFRKWLEFARWRNVEILLEYEQIVFQLLVGVNDLAFPEELGYQREIL